MERAPPGACPDDARPIVQLHSKQEEGRAANHKHFRIERPGSSRKPVGADPDPSAEYN
jgi:hypothetical protein